MQYNQTRLLVNDFPACYRFYRDVIGLTPTQDDDGVYASFYRGASGEGASGIALFKRQDMAEATGAMITPFSAASDDRVAIVFSADDVDESYRQLTADGLEFVTRPADHPDWGIRTVHLRDPDGNLVEIYSDLPASS